MTQEVITFGCRLNSYESEVIRDNLRTTGLEKAAVFNTCAVTKESERQAKQAIRKYKRENPESKIIVTGCAAQINPDHYADLEEVDRVIGNEEKLDQKTYASLSTEETEKVLVNDIMSIKETASHLVSGFEGKARAFMQIQNGCNHRCTFCIIPYGRGNNRSVAVGEIVEQARLLVKNGYNEIVLTGVDISDYGQDLPVKTSLGQMIKRLLKLVPELPRLRLSSIDVAEIDEDLLELIEKEPRLMPHLHLSLQSGDNMILKRMKRRHTREQILDFCNKARELRPDIVFGADIITGFPTETDEMFNNTVDVIKQAEITYLHVFPYSEREGTPAAKIPSDKQVPKKIRKERAAILRDLGKLQLEKLLKSRVGKTENVIVEKESEGRTEQFAMVKLDQDYSAGNIVKISVAGANNEVLLEKKRA